MVKSIQSVVVMSVSIQSELGIEVGIMVLTMVMSSGHTCLINPVSLHQSLLRFSRHLGLMIDHNITHYFN